jgi:hypothetical protein
LEPHHPHEVAHHPPSSSSVQQALLAAAATGSLPTDATSPALWQGVQQVLAGRMAPLQAQYCALVDEHRSLQQKQLHTEQLLRTVVAKLKEERQMRAQPASTAATAAATSPVIGTSASVGATPTFTSNVAGLAPPPMNMGVSPLAAAALSVLSSSSSSSPSPGAGSNQHRTPTPPPAVASSSPSPSGGSTPHLSPAAHQRQMTFNRRATAGANVMKKN